jgi:hypothetical protein
MRPVLATMSALLRRLAAALVEFSSAGCAHLLVVAAQPPSDAARVAAATPLTADEEREWAALVAGLSADT